MGSGTSGSSTWERCCQKPCLPQARAAQISAEVDQTIAAYAVLASIGQLTAEQLGLDVPRYDPAAYYDLVKTAPVTSRQGEELDRVLRALGKN